MAASAACGFATDPSGTRRDGGSSGTTDATLDDRGTIVSSDGTASDGPAPFDDASADDASTADAAPAVCTLTPAAEPFRNPRTALHWRATPGIAFANAEQVCATPVVADIVPEPAGTDTIPEIAFVTFDCATRRGVLRVISGRAPHTLLWSQNGAGAPNDASAAGILRWDGHVAVGDLDGNRANGLEVVAVTATGTPVDGLIAYHGDGTVYWRATAGAAALAGANPSVNIADLDADGRPEVIAGALAVNGQTGALRWAGTGARGVNGQGPLAVVCDLDPASGNGHLEVIAGGTVYESDGRVRFANGDGFSAVGDVLDASGHSGHDGVPEVVVVTGGHVNILDVSTGAVRWTAMIPGAMGAGGAPTIADFDGDGEAEIGVAGASRYALFDPQCTVAGGECDSVGIRWQTVTEDMSSAVTSSTVFDFNGDGASEVVYNDEERFQVLDGRTGTVVFWDWNPSQTRTEQPIVADADGDGQADIVFGANTCEVFAGNTIPQGLQATQRVPGLEVWSSADGAWVGARTIWNEHGYHIDNVSEDGTIPHPEPAPWRSHNSFRLNAPRDRRLLAPNAADSPSDASSCSGTEARVCVHVTNRGDARLGLVRVGVYADGGDGGGALLGSESTSQVLDPGETSDVCVMVPADGVAPSYVVRVDDTGAVRECDETDNSTRVTVQCGPG